MSVKNIAGMKYPDEYVTKYFFKEGLHNKSGKVVEFGCGNGNNLALFYEYGFETFGVDIATKSIEDANSNFKDVYEGKDFHFFAQDMMEFVKENVGLEADVFLLPNIISYLTKEQLVLFLNLCKKNSIYKRGAKFFLRTRTKKDFRYGLGEIQDSFTSILTNDITGEKGATCSCYEENELLDIFKNSLNITNITINHLDNQNCHGDMIVLNSDIAIWGEVE